MLVGAVACTPTLNWRDVRLADARVQLQFPCRPASQTRAVPLAGRRVEMHLWACQARDMTFALSWAEVEQPDLVTPALRELIASTLANVQATAPIRSAAVRVEGMTPNAAALRVRLAGRHREGAPVQAESVVFASGTRVFQATVLGTEPEWPAVQIFVDALMVRP